MAISDTGIGGAREFPTTAWQLIDEALGAEGAARARYLGHMIELYWKPVYCVIRRVYAGARGGDAHQDAKDLTQEFFATVVLDRDLIGHYDRGRGSFRTLLRTALTRFMHDVARSGARDKRGGGVRVVALDALRVEDVPAVEEDRPLTPDELFDAAWNQALLQQAFRRLEERLRGQGRASAFEVFRRYDLEGDSRALSYEALGAELGLTAAQVRHALEAARRGFREIVTELVRAYVDGPEELAAEVRMLGG